MTGSSQPNKQGLFNPDVLSQIPNVTLRVQFVVSSILSGIHRSSHHGSSIEFSEHKVYSDGDDPRWIDWKVFAKTDKYYIKQFENESSVPVCLVIDSSSSMGYTGSEKKGLSKLDYALVLMASLAYVIVKQHDSLSLLISSKGNTQFFPLHNKRDSFNLLVKKFETITPQPGENLASCLLQLTEHIKKRGVIIIASDFLEDEKGILKSLLLLKNQQQHIKLLHTLSPFELTFPFTGIMEMYDMEFDEKNKISIDPKKVQKHYLTELHSFINWWETQSKKCSFDYQMIDTSMPITTPLLKIFKS